MHGTRVLPDNSLGYDKVMLQQAMQHVEMQTKTQVIIVGAGISGLAAARHLTDAGVSTVILEANPKSYGGRIRTVRENGYAIELGAEWVHRGSNKKHNIRCLCARNNIPLIRDPRSFQMKGEHDQKPRPGASRFIDRIEDLVDEISDELSGADAADTSMMDALLTLSTGKDATLVQSDAAGAALRYVAGDCAAEMSQVSAKYYNYNSPDSVWRGGADMKFGAGWGYADVVDRLYAVHPCLDVRLGQEVTRIEVQRQTAVPDPVLVTTSDGQQHGAESVIVTVPLGVLKAERIQFSPALSQAKQNVFKNSLGFGHYGKVIFVFDSIFWKLHDYVAFDVRSTRKEKIIPEFVVNYGKIYKQPLLVMTISEPYAKTADELSDDELQETLLGFMTRYLLFPMAAEDIKSRLVSFHRSQWSKDPHTLGAYSYPRVGVTPADFYELHTPHAGHVYFAGEHTAYVEGIWAETEGAFVSGLRAAEQVIDRQKIEANNNVT